MEWEGRGVEEQGASVGGEGRGVEEQGVSVGGEGRGVEGCEGRELGSRGGKGGVERG